MTIVVPNRGDPLVDDSGRPSIRFSDVLEELVDKVNDLTANIDPITANTDEYTVSNDTADRTFDADAAAGTISDPPTKAEVENIRDAVLELADVVGTLIADVKKLGIVP